MAEQSIWMRNVEADPGHSHWYVKRFRTMARDGGDLVGEARLVDSMVARGARILDAGCGPGRLAGIWLRQAITSSVSTLTRYSSRQPSRIIPARAGLSATWRSSTCPRAA
ncbi:MAG: hypothetical protein NVSMB60_11460 [Mycobacterium sp.]